MLRVPTDNNDYQPLLLQNHVNDSTNIIMHDHVDYENIPTNTRGQPMSTTTRRSSSGSRRSILSLGLWGVILIVVLVAGVIHFQSRVASEDNEPLSDSEPHTVASDAANDGDKPVVAAANALSPQVAWIMSFGGSVSRT